MTKFKLWLFRRFLPEYCRNALLEENERLRTQLTQCRQERDRLQAYADGLEAGMRCLRRITINNNSSGKEG